MATTFELLSVFRHRENDGEYGVRRYIMAPATLTARCSFFSIPKISGG